MRGRVKRARAVVADTPSLAETLAGDWRKATRFCAKFGITEEALRHGSEPAPDRPSSIERNALK